MRTAGANVFVAIGAFLAVLAGSGCTTSNDALVASDIDLSGAGAAETTLSSEASGSDNLSARSPDQAPTQTPAETSAQAASGDAADSPTPPTLATLPAPAAPINSSTAAPTTSVPTTSQATPSSTPSSPSTTTPTSSAERAEGPKPTPETTDLPAAAIDQSTTTAPVPAGPNLTPGEGQSFALLNVLRAALGLTELSRNGELDAFARDWSRQMAETGRFEHSAGPYGENIAFTSNTNLSAAQAAELFHQLWVDSPGHYANMTNDTYLTSGVGLYLTERGWYGTHVFGF